MKKLSRLLSLTLLFSFVSAPALFADSFTAEQRQEVQGIIKDYLIKNPEILLDVSQALQQKQQQLIMLEAEGAIRANVEDIFSANSPTTGNAEGSLWLVVFSDYQCMHCKRMKGLIDELATANEELRIVNKELPILNDKSEFAARAALAAHAQEKYAELQHELFQLHPPLTEQQVIDAARAANVNIRQLQKDMASHELQAELDNNLGLAYELKLLGTPAFIFATGVGTEDMKIFFIPGAASAEQLQEAIKHVSS